MTDSRPFWKRETALFFSILPLSYIGAEAIGNVAGILLSATASMAIAIAIAATALFVFRQYVLGKRNSTFGIVVSDTIDSIMIGAAETAFFIEMVKKKIDADIVTVERMLALSQENAVSTHGISGNAEKAALIAAKVRNECFAGRTQVSDALRCIGIARDGSHNAAAAWCPCKKSQGVCRRSRK